MTSAIDRWLHARVRIAVDARCGSCHRQSISGAHRGGI
jgi:hypothetical protein